MEFNACTHENVGLFGNYLRQVGRQGAPQATGHHREEVNKLASESKQATMRHPRRAQHVSQLLRDRRHALRSRKQCEEDGSTVVRRHLPTAEELRARGRRLALVLVQQEAPPGCSFTK